jgi:hypothetical protein
MPCSQCSLCERLAETRAHAGDQKYFRFHHVVLLQADQNLLERALACSLMKRRNEWTEAKATSE